MLFKFIIAITTSTSFVLALDKHNPKVYEEDAEDAFPGVVRKARHHYDVYRPPIFVYDKSAQPDLRKWRYYQQQQVDLKNMQKTGQRFRSVNGFLNSPQPHYRDEAKDTLEVEDTSKPYALEPKWKVVHPKFVTEERNDFSPSDLIKMQEEYGKRKLQRVPTTTRPTTNRRARKTESNVLGDAAVQSRDYKVKEADLEAEASEMQEIHAPIERQDHISVVLPTNIIPKAIYIDPNAIGKLVSTNVPVDSANAQNYDQTGQRDVDALNSLLGSTASQQLNRLQQFLHSQSAHVTPLPSDLSQSLSSVIAANLQNSMTDTMVENPEIQKILQNKDQTLDEMQAQLNAISEQEGAKAIAEAQQRALDYVQSQQRALEYAELEGRKAALDSIKTYNLQLPESLPQALPLTHHSQPQIEDAVSSQNLNHHTTIVENAEEVPKSLPRSVDENTILHAQLQAQAYLRLASQSYGPAQQKDPIPNSSDVQNSPAFIHPEVNNNGLNGIKMHQQLSQEGSNINEAHTQLQAQAYENLATQAYEAPTEDLQQLYANGQNEGHQGEETYQEERNVSSKDEYAPKYSFGYRIMDYHTGTDYGHEETREGKSTKGRYHVLLPDGRVQLVNYWADLSGYHAKVTYSNDAHH